jgi:urease
MSHLIGSVEVGKLADLVLYKPAHFGTRPNMIIKAGQIAWAHVGDANGSIPCVQPVYGKPMWGALGKAASMNSIAFVSGVSIDEGHIAPYGLSKRVERVIGCRSIGKKDMKLNDNLPKITVDPET